MKQHPLDCVEPTPSGRSRVRSAGRYSQASPEPYPWLSPLTDAVPRTLHLPCEYHRLLPGRQRLNCRFTERGHAFRRGPAISYRPDPATSPSTSIPQPEHLRCQHERSAMYLAQAGARADGKAHVIARVFRPASVSAGASVAHVPPRRGCWRPSPCNESPRQQLMKGLRIDRGLVRGDLDRSSGAMRRRVEEQPGRFGATPLREHHVDDLAELVDRPVAVPPDARHLQVALIIEPAVTIRMPAGAGCRRAAESEPLHPPIRRRPVRPTVLPGSGR
jgi:hypothetical protein